MSYPASIFGKLTDTYLASAYTNGLPGGMFAEQEFFNAQTGKRYRLVLSAAAITAGKAVMRSAATTVIPTAAATDWVEGVNETGGTVADATYFWATVEGPVTVLVTASQAIGVILGASGTSGTLDVGSAAAVQCLRCVVLVASGSGGATSCRLY